MHDDSVYGRVDIPFRENLASRIKNGLIRISGYPVVISRKHGRNHAEFSGTQ